jgi:hypothetical protein
MPGRLLTPLFAITLFFGAGLLFSVQPMVSKILLPTLGGAPAVWITAMVFFQSVLLVGYFYAFVSTKMLSVRSQVILHLSLLIAALGSFPSRSAMPGDLQGPTLRRAGS